MTRCRCSGGCDGSSVAHRAAVLRRPITAGGYGRPLTSTEARDLRARGWRIHRRAIVVRQVSDIPRLGIVYFPAARKYGGGYNHAGIYVETM